MSQATSTARGRSVSYSRSRKFAKPTIAPAPRLLRRRIDFQRRAYERAVACCATTFWAADSIVRDYGVSPDKVHVVGVGRFDDECSRPRFDAGREADVDRGPKAGETFQV